MYFTLREMGGSWKEECAIRHVGPALALQLELGRLSNYRLAPTFAQNKQLRICNGIVRGNQLDNSCFIRATVRPGRIRGEVSMDNYLISETNRLVTSTPDSLEVVSARHRSAGYNHTFINFTYNVPMTYSDVSDAISGFIARHEKRSWRLHVAGFKIRICWRMKREISPSSDASSRAFPASSSTSVGVRGTTNPYAFSTSTSCILPRKL